MPQNKGLSDENRERVIENIMSWKEEYERGTSRDFNFSQFREELTNKSNEELRQTWMTTVGEWIGHRDDVFGEWEEQRSSGEFQGSFEEFIEYQYERVVEGKETCYGFV